MIVISLDTRFFIDIICWILKMIILWTIWALAKPWIAKGQKSLRYVQQQLCIGSLNGWMGNTVLFRLYSSGSEPSSGDEDLQGGPVLRPPANSCRLCIPFFSA